MTLEAEKSRINVLQCEKESLKKGHCFNLVWNKAILCNNIVNLRKSCMTEWLRCWTQDLKVQGSNPSQEHLLNRGN